MAKRKMTVRVWLVINAHGGYFDVYDDLHIAQEVANECTQSGKYPPYRVIELKRTITMNGGEDETNAGK